MTFLGDRYDLDKAHGRSWDDERAVGHPGGTERCSSQRARTILGETEIRLVDGHETTREGRSSFGSSSRVGPISGS